MQMTASHTDMDMDTDDLPSVQSLPSDEKPSDETPSQYDPPPVFDTSLEPDALEERIKQYTAWLERESKLSPILGPKHDPGTLLSDHDTARRYWAKQQAQSRMDGRRKTATTIAGFEKQFSTTPLDRLQRIPIRSMLVRNVHYGNYLLCRSISLPLGPISAYIIVQDPDGDVVGLTIYNFPTVYDGSEAYLDTLFPLGTIFAIREPVYKLATTGNFQIVRVDTPTDIVLLNPQDELLQGIEWKDVAQAPKLPPTPSTPDSWRLQGNALFQNNEWLPAAIAYSRGLKMNPELMTIRLNRSEAYLRLGYFSGALYDSYYVLNSPAADTNQRLKALYRAGRAEYGRGNFEQAIAHLNSFCALNPQPDQTAHEWIDRCQKRLNETRGNYDWIELHQRSQITLHPEVGEYQGPIVVQYLQHRGGGRGIVASRDIAIGELLLVCKPFMSVFKKELRGFNDMFNLVTVDLLSKKLERRSQSALRSHVAQKLYGNPDLYRAVFDLYAGPNFPTPPSSYSPKRSEEVVCVDALCSNIDIDISRLDGICSYNCFQPQPIERVGSSIYLFAEEEEDLPSALYLLPSLVNHSCAGNARWTTFGDVMVVRATQNIGAGEEITFTYPGTGLMYPTRSKSLQHYLPSPCDCWLCQEDLNDGESAIQRRYEIISDLSPIALRRLSLPQLRAKKDAVNATYAQSRGAVRPEMVQLHREDAKKTRGLSNSTLVLIQAIEAEIQALMCMGIVVLDDPANLSATGQNFASDDGGLPIATSSVAMVHWEEALEIMFAIARDYCAMQRRDQAVRWLRAAQWLTSLIVGGPKEVFMYFVAPLLRRKGLFELATEAL